MVSLSLRSLGFFFQLIFVSFQLLVRIASDGTLHCEQNAINDEREYNSI